MASHKIIEMRFFNSLGTTFIAMQGGTLEDYWSRKLLTMQRVGSEHGFKRDRTSQVWKRGIVSLFDSAPTKSTGAGWIQDGSWFFFAYKQVSGATWDGLRCLNNCTRKYEVRQSFTDWHSSRPDAKSQIVRLQEISDDTVIIRHSTHL